MALLASGSAFAARLEAEFTWNTANYGIGFFVGTDTESAFSYRTAGGYPTEPCGGNAQPVLSSSIPGGSWTQVPCGGLGPVRFTLDPAYAATFTFRVQMMMVARDYHLVNTPYGWLWAPNESAEPATVTMRLLMDGTEAARATLLLSTWDNGHVILTYTPDLTGVVFDITDVAAAPDRRVLLSNTKDSANAPLAPYPFFQGLLARDRVVPIGLRTYVNGIATSGVAVTLRLLDPPDLSPYIVGVAGGQPAPGAALSHDGDNVGTVAPTLTGTGITANDDGTYSATSRENGYISAELALDPAARPGDNYRVEGSFTGAPNTATSGVLTAWRRIFFEKRTMFRKGNPIVADAPAGVSHVIVPNLSIVSNGTEQFAANDEIVLLHAPKHGEPKPDGSFYEEYRKLTAATPFTAPSTLPANGTGTLTLVAGSTTINGSGTRFSRLVAESSTTVGTVINVGSERFIVLAIDNNTRMTVTPAAATSGTGLSYTTGDSQLTPSANYVRLTLSSPLTRAFATNVVAGRAPTIVLNDAVAKISSSGAIAPADYFDADDSLLVESVDYPSNVFPASYAQYIPRPDESKPLPRTLLTSADGTLSQAFIDKWFRIPTAVAVSTTLSDPLLAFHYTLPANHQLILIGDNNPIRDAGVTFLRVQSYPHREASSVVFRGQVEREIADNTSPLYQLDAAQVLRKVEVHEVAHQWWVNNGPPGHCNAVGYDSSMPYPVQQTPPAATPAGTMFCTMAFDGALTMPAPWSPFPSILQTVRQYGNGHTAFHMTVDGNGVWDSEYLMLRRAADPWQP